VKFIAAMELRAIPKSHWEKREVLLAQHQALRALIGAVRLVAEEHLASRATPSELIGCIGQLRAGLEAHLCDEEAYLVPVLERLDAWGPERLALLRAEHAHQRAVLAVLCGPSAPGVPEILARRALSLADDLLADMESEERTVLDARSLRDDMVLVDQAED